MELQGKVCYDTSTGKVLFVATELKQDLPKSYYKKVFVELKDYTESQFDFITMDYNTFITTFKNAKSYSVNLTTKQLEVTYYTADELNAMQSETTTTV